MGLVNAEITLKNQLAVGQPEITVNALVDTAATYLCIPEPLARQLHLETEDFIDIELADGRKMRVPQGMLKISYRGRSGYCSALVLGNEVLLGAVPMQELNLIVIPKTHELDINPKPIRV